MLVQKQILQNNYKTPRRAYGSVSFRGEVEPYFKQGAIVSSQDSAEFMKKYAFTTEKQILQTKLRPLPTDEYIKEIAFRPQLTKEEIKKSIIAFDKRFIAWVEHHAQASPQDFPPYHPSFENNKTNVEKNFKKAQEIISFPLGSNEDDDFKIARIQSQNLLEHEQFILNDYNKRGLKDFICGQILYSSPDKEKTGVLYSLKTKHFDSDLSEDVRKVVQRAYDDFGVIIFPVNDKQIAMNIYDSLQVTHKTAMSVGDKIPEIRIIDAASMYKSTVNSAGFYNYNAGLVGINPVNFDEINPLLQHEISGHALHYSNSMLQYVKKDYNKLPLGEYLNGKGIQLYQPNYFNLHTLFKEANIPYRHDKIDYMITSMHECVAVLKEHLNFLPFDKLEGSLEKVQELLEACSAPKGFFADRVILPKEFKPNQWKELAEQIARRIK